MGDLEDMMEAFTRFQEGIPYSPREIAVADAGAFTRRLLAAGVHDLRTDPRDGPATSFIGIKIVVDRELPPGTAELRGESRWDTVRIVFDP